MNANKVLKLFLWLSILLLLLCAACGTSSNGDSSDVPTEPSADEVSDATPAEPPSGEDGGPTAESPLEDAPSGAASSVEEVQNAVIQIEYLGSFKDPQVGAVSGYGYGSGFIIDPSGIAVTNNHVVAGAASIKVRIGGDTSKTYNAKILGVSECSDLAVIDIEGDGFPYLEWYEGDITVGMDVYAAGFPLGEPEYALTRGVISKAAAPGETAWASVDGVLGHDATINPGNSGGPLFNKDGQVVGVNYRSRPDYDQYFAISAEKAIQLTEQLKAGTDVDSIGVNGQAVIWDDGGTHSGVWVSSVVPGSPADQAELKGGDVILTMSGVAVATDGTMADYCDILRSHNASDTLDIQVVRYETKEILEGQINGVPLSVAASFGQAAEEASGGDVAHGSLVQFKGSLSSGGGEGADTFKFLSLAGGAATLYVAPISPDLDVSIVILDSDDKTVAVANDAGAGETERLVFAHPTNDMKTYTIYVMGGDTGGDYKATFVGTEKIVFALNPQYVILGSPPAGESLLYFQVGKAGETLNILAKSDSKNPMDISIRVMAFDDLGTVLAHANDGGYGEPESLSYTFPASNIYFIMVSDDNSSGDGGSFVMIAGVK